MTGRPHLKPSETDPPRAPDAAMAAFMAPQMQHLCAAQTRLFDEAGSFAGAWFARRHRMAEALGCLGADLAQAGGDGPRIAEAMSRWQSGAQERLAADMRDWMTLCTNCTGHLLREANETEDEVLGTTIELARRAGRTKHATPI